MYRRLASGLYQTSQRKIAQVQQKSVFVPETIVTTLPSGFRIATENTGGSTATIGVFIDAGSRYENEKNNGTAHFLEHMAFKGTPRRTRMGLELEVENIGAHLNAYTSRESTTYYAKCFTEKLDQSVDILSDILLNSSLAKKDIEAERGVIIREMEEVAQNFQEVVFDILHTYVYEGNPLSFTILGPEERIRTIDQKDLQNYINTHYRSGRMVLAAAGGVNHDEVVRMAEKYFGGLQHGDSSQEFVPAVYQAKDVYGEIPELPMLYGAMVVEGVSWTHEDNLALMVANTLMGEFDRSRGFGVNAPTDLAVLLSSDEGIQSFQSFNTCYKETGLVGTYFVVAPESVDNLIENVLMQWVRLASSIDEAAVERAKRSLLTNLLLMLDGSTPVCEDIGRQLISYGRRIPIPELKARIEMITVEQLREVCQRVFLEGHISSAVVGKTKHYPSREEIEGRRIRLINN
ncbi:CBN-MPPB-1 protein [Caenorhabditis brenneri]|uniref:CBN-MPPB-1 protein n=1 Tax=Caenorhabditis brenneri TaxID=135651 RepID=G0NMP4_CAEBE|nr:CBN-MPPB-1 protein [Caenorhabditis brenneri]